MNEKSLEQNGLGLTPETDPDLLPAFIQQHFWSASYVLGKAPGDVITKSHKARPLPYKSPPQGRQGLQWKEVDRAGASRPAWRSVSGASPNL